MNNQPFNPQGLPQSVSSHNLYNDYKLSEFSAPKILVHQRHASTSSIYLNSKSGKSSLAKQQNSNRKKLTVTTSRDASAEKSRQVQYYSNNASKIHMDSQQSQSNREGSNLFHRHQKRILLQDSSNTHGLGGSASNLFQKNKLRSPNNLPQTPQRGHKLDRSKSKRFIESEGKCLSKEHIDFRPTSRYRLKLSNSKNKIEGYVESSEIEKLKDLFQRRLSEKISQFNDKIASQEQYIQALQVKLRNNEAMMHERANFTQPFYKPNCQQESINSSYIMKRVSDLEAGFRKVTQFVRYSFNCQKKLQAKIKTLEELLVRSFSFKLAKVKNQVQDYLQANSKRITEMIKEITCLDNKLIGRSQALKETLASLKNDVQKLEDNCTRDTNQSQKQSWGLQQMISCQNKSVDVSEGTSGKSNNKIQMYSNRIKNLISDQCENESDSKLTKKGQQNSLNFSLTSLTEYGQTDIMAECKQQQENSFLMRKDQTCLTDQFFYPGSSSNSSVSRDISPIHQKKGKSKDSQQNSRSPSPIDFIKKETPHNYEEPIQQKPAVKVDNKTINRKIEAIRHLMEQKRRNCEETHLEPLRCFIDKSGYLKYTDSKTFVFDGKGNLMPCTQGELWFLVTKGLVEGKQQSTIIYEMP